jgi:hypothetical protein
MERDRGQGSPEGKPKKEDRAPLKEQVKPKGESELGKLLEEKRLFAVWAPKGRDPESYPIEAMKEIQSELTERIEKQYAASEYLPEVLIQGVQMKAVDQILIDKLYSLRESARKIERVLEIIVYPVLQNQELKKNIKEDLMDDTKRYGRRSDVELNDEELEAIGKLTRVRLLPFDPEKRLYEYSQVPGYDEAMLFSRTVFY